MALYRFHKSALFMLLAMNPDSVCILHGAYILQVDDGFVLAAVLVTAGARFAENAS